MKPAPPSAAAGRENLVTCFYLRDANLLLYIRGVLTPTEVISGRLRRKTCCLQQRCRLSWERGTPYCRAVRKQPERASCAGTPFRFVRERILFLAVHLLSRGEVRCN